MFVSRGYSDISETNVASRLRVTLSNTEMPSKGSQINDATDVRDIQSAQVR